MHLRVESASEFNKAKSEKIRIYSKKHYNSVSATLRYFGEICNPAKPSAVDFQMLEQYVTERLAQGKSNTKVNNELAGHRSVQTNMRYYAGVRAQSMKAATDRLCKYAAAETA